MVSHKFMTLLLNHCGTKAFRLHDLQWTMSLFPDTFSLVRHVSLCVFLHNSCTTVFISGEDDVTSTWEGRTDCTDSQGGRVPQRDRTQWFLLSTSNNRRDSGFITTTAHNSLHFSLWSCLSVCQQQGDVLLVCLSKSLICFEKHASC